MSSSKIKSYKWSPEAYTVAVYHSLKHSGSNCCGILLGKVESGCVVFEKAVPISHSHALSPPLKLACIAAETLGKKDGLDIMGFYCANQLLAKEDLRPLYRSIFDKFVANNPLCSCWIMLPKMLEEDEICFKGSTIVRGDLSSIADNLVEASLNQETLRKNIGKLEYMNVVDFDDHLHTPSKDWTNQELEGKIAAAAGA